MVQAWLCSSCRESLCYKVAALKRDFMIERPVDLEIDGYFPPPWDFIKYPEKTDGWLEFQKEARKHPEYYQM